MMVGERLITMLSNKLNWGLVISEAQVSKDLLNDKVISAKCTLASSGCLGDDCGYVLHKNSSYGDS